MKKAVPLDFVELCQILKTQNKLSVNYLTEYYKTSPSVINRWLSESDIFMSKQNAKKELFINLDEFSKDVASGQMTLAEVTKKYNLSTRNVHNICNRIGANKNLKCAAFNPENADDFLSYLKAHGKSETSKKYNITISTITGWCRKNKIILPKYLGSRKKDVDDKISDIKSLYENGYTQSFIGKLYGTTGAKIKRLLSESGVNTKTKFDIWKEERTAILNNLDLYVRKNKDGLNLIEIANQYNISYEVLKDAFSVGEVEVILHSKNKSAGELELKEFINSLGLHCESIRKTHNKIKYEIDCFVDEKKFGIEYCGEYWHSKNSGKPRKYHQDKMLWCLDQGIQLMTIFEHEWVSKKPLLKSMIKSRLGICENRIYARNADCCIISKGQAKVFHDKNHISGGLTTSTIDFGLFHNNELISVASFSKSRFSKDAEYEILRFSTLQNYLVVGGFSKLFAHFVELINPKTVVSFCDLRFGKGAVYTKSKFKCVSLTPPNYWYYFKANEKMGEFESRIKYQKHKLKHFSNYADAKTEYDIMNENGYLQIFDCGNYKFIYENGGS